jgi:hypothetical protein
MSGSRLLEERTIGDGAVRGQHGRMPARSVTVNAAESPLGWLLAHNHLTRRQFEAGELLRADYERANLGQRTTMAPSRKLEAAWATSCGAWCARARECATPRARSVGRHGRASWC